MTWIVSVTYCAKDMANLKISKMTMGDFKSVEFDENGEFHILKVALCMGDLSEFMDIIGTCTDHDAIESIEIVKKNIGNCKNQKSTD